MTYKKLFYLKFKKGVSTYELVRRFPTEVARVNDIALIEVPDSTLREVVREKSDFQRVMKLKRRFLRFL